MNINKAVGAATITMFLSAGLVLAHPDLDGPFVNGDPFVTSKLNQLRGRTENLEQSDKKLAARLKNLEKRVFPAKHAKPKPAKLGNHSNKSRPLEKRKK